MPRQHALGRNSAEDRHADPGSPLRGGEADPTLAAGHRSMRDKDLVEEASEESFPASDPSSFSPTTVS